MSRMNAQPQRAAANQVSSRAWQRMLSGRRLDLLDPKPEDIAIEDIAHGLARVARWNGQTLGEHAFSVAQHVLVVEEITTDRNPDWDASWRLAALLHDAPEYVVGDLISPFKTAIGLDYKSFENRLLEAIYARFALPPRLPEDIAGEIKTADHIAAYFEATGLAGFARDEALLYFGAPEGISAALNDQLSAIAPMPAATAQNAFLDRFHALSGSRATSR